ncbi:peptidase M56, BlaR1 [Shewanella sp. OPT22]|nr:peptidase M56, BlaR1 [Shewanella sp. OPT22]
MAVLSVFADVSVAMLQNQDMAGSFISHWHHIDSFYFASWHGALLICWFTVAGFLVFSKSFSLLKHLKQMSMLDTLAIHKSDNVYHLKSDCVSAFTSGMFTPKCYISDGMLNTTSDSEQDIIVKHEQAHAINRDPMKKWLFSVLASFFIGFISTRLKLHMSLAMEQMADDSVAKATNRNTDIASTLIKITRINQSINAKLQQECITNFGANVMEQRVLFLLGQLENKPVRKSISFTILAMTIVCCLLSIDSIHHLIEFFFKH